MISALVEFENHIHVSSRVLLAPGENRADRSAPQCTASTVAAMAEVSAAAAVAVKVAAPASCGAASRAAAPARGATYWGGATISTYGGGLLLPNPFFFLPSPFLSITHLLLSSCVVVVGSLC